MAECSSPLTESKLESSLNTELKPETTSLITESKSEVASTIIDPIPEPPPIPEGTEEILNRLNALGEPTFASLGLGTNSPVGIAQQCFEYLHVNLGIQWWAAIAIGKKEIIRTFRLYLECMFILE